MVHLAEMAGDRLRSILFGVLNDANIRLLLDAGLDGVVKFLYLFAPLLSDVLWLNKLTWEDRHGISHQVWS